MSNPKKRYDFDNSFCGSLRSPKRPKLEVIQRPSGSLPRNESFENTEENDDLWGDELETDAVEEVLLLESQACSMIPQISTPHISEKTSSAVFKPKTAVISSTKTSPFIKGADRSDVSKASGSGTGFKGNYDPFTTPASVSHAIQPLVVEKVKSNVIGKGCQRSSSFPIISFPHSSSSSKKPGIESKNFMVKRPSFEDVNQCNETKSEVNETYKILKEKVEKLKAENLTKAGEAALLRQKIKDAGLELEKERQHRAELLEKANQKHQEEIAAVKRELEAARTQLQFKEHDVDDALEKCKLLKSGAIKVRPLEVKTASPGRPSTSNKQQDFPNKSTFVGDTPRKKPPQGNKKEREFMREREFQDDTFVEKLEEPLKEKFIKVGVQTENIASVLPKLHTDHSPGYSEGRLLSNLIVPHWFEMDSGATEEQFEGKWEGISAVTELFKLDTFEGRPLEIMVEWCWQRMLRFITILRQKKEDDFKFHQMKEESRKQYDEWCLDRRIPLPTQKARFDEAFQEDWYSEFAEEAVGDELQCLLSYRPWCPKDVMPEIRRTLALAVALMKASKNISRVFASHNEKVEKKCSKCFICDCVIRTEDGDCQEKCVESMHSKDMGSLQGNCVDCDSQSQLITRNSSELPEKSKEVHIDDNSKQITSHNLLSISKGAKKYPSSVGEMLPSDNGAVKVVGEIGKLNEMDQNIPDVEVDVDTKDFLTFDFVHLVQQICRIISRMRKIVPMEGTLAGVLVFLSSLNQRMALSDRGLTLVSAVIKNILLIRPHFRVLIHLMQLLVSTAEYPLILQKMCINSGLNAAYRRKDNWVFTDSVCPLQILITVLENITDEKVPEGLSQEAWFVFRAKIGYHFIRWLTITLGQSGHQVDWLCYPVPNDIHEELRREGSPKEEEEVAMEINGADGSKQEEKRPNSGATKATSSMSVEEGKMEVDGKGESSAENVPIKTLPKMHLTEEEEAEFEETVPRCCCRRWMMNLIVNILYAILLDFQAVLHPSFKIESVKEANQMSFKRNQCHITNKELVFEQSRILRLGIFVLRELLLRGHPEFNTPGGEGFQWNHYTIKGSLLSNGNIVTKDYGHKNGDGGPIAGRYLLLLTRIERSLKHRIVGFFPQTEEALQELLEVESSLENTSDVEEDDPNLWESFKKLGCS